MAMQQIITIRASDTMSTQKPTGDPPNRGTWSLFDASPGGGWGTSEGSMGIGLEVDCGGCGVESDRRFGNKCI